MTVDLIGLIVIAVVVYVAYLIINLIPMDGTLKRIIFIVLGIVAFLAILQSLGVYNSGTHLNIKTP